MRKKKKKKKTGKLSYSGDTAGTGDENGRLIRTHYLAA